MPTQSFFYPTNFYILPITPENHYRENMNSLFKQMRPAFLHPLEVHQRLDAFPTESPPVYGRPLRERLYHA
jgi:hypothetical protein